VREENKVVLKVTFWIMTVFAYLILSILMVENAKAEVPEITTTDRLVWLYEQPKYRDAAIHSAIYAIMSYLEGYLDLYANIAASSGDSYDADVYLSTYNRGREYMYACSGLVGKSYNEVAKELIARAMQYPDAKLTSAVSIHMVTICPEEIATIAMLAGMKPGSGSEGT
jgi:hypothetical protein